jgi:hypothetical protein
MKEMMVSGFVRDQMGKDSIEAGMRLPEHDQRNMPRHHTQPTTGSSDGDMRLEHRNPIQPGTTKPRGEKKRKK